MPKKTDILLECCLYFTANSLARAITRIGEEEFSTVGMSPSYAFLLSLTIDTPGISQKELSALLHIAPSTVSRFVETLMGKGLVTKEIDGRNTLIYPTDKGKELKTNIDQAWTSLYNRYSEVLGEDQGRKLTELTASASRKLHDST